MQEMQVWFLSWEDPLEEEMATHTRILTWKIPRTEEPGGLQSMGSQNSQIWLSNLTTVTVLPQLCLVTAASQLAFLIPPSLLPNMTLTSLDIELSHLLQIKNSHYWSLTCIMAGLAFLTHFQQLFPSTHNLIFCYCPASTGQVDVASINLGFLKTADTQCLLFTVQCPRHLEIIPLPSSLFLLFLREKNNLYYWSWSHPLRPCHMQISLSCHQWIEFNHSLFF